MLQMGYKISWEADESSEGIVDFNEAEVTSKGNITATFTIPGLISIPSDGVAHNVTIAQLSLDADMEWVSIPKLEAKVHLKVCKPYNAAFTPRTYSSPKAIVKNDSEYTFLSGPASVYVDGSFIARTSLPAVSPEETFDCPLGSVAFMDHSTLELTIAIGWIPRFALPTSRWRKRHPRLAS
jgi:hypothetical protein